MVSPFPIPRPYLEMNNLENLTILDIRREAEAFFRLAIENLHEQNVPLYDIAIFGQQPWITNYKGRKHIYMHNNTNAAVVITSTDNIYKISIPANSWLSIAAPQGAAFTTSAAQQFPIVIRNEDVQ